MWPLATRKTPDPTKWELVSFQDAFTLYKVSAHYRNKETQRVKRFVFRGEGWATYFQTQKTFP